MVSLFLSSLKVRSIQLVAIALLLPSLAWSSVQHFIYHQAEGISQPMQDRVAPNHDDLHEQIARLTKLIKKDPKNASLYYQRASLYHGHDMLEEGLADYRKALSLGYDEPDIYYFMARLYRVLEDPDTSSMYIDHFMEMANGEMYVAGLIERARINAAFGRYERAISDYNEALNREDIATIDHYLELTEATRQIHPDRPEEAVAVLDRGIERLGAVPALQFRALELEQQAGHIDAAIARIDQMMEGKVRKESYYFKKAEILRASGQVEAARENYQLAKEAIEALPPNRKQTVAMIKLQYEIDSALQAVGH